MFDRASVVYLSPDAEEPLQEVLATEVYVVGGIVDRNLNRGLTLAAADGGRARAVRLPFAEYLPEVSRKDRVLTVCACVGVLMGVHAGQDWREALKKSVPQRGIAQAASRARAGACRGVSGPDGLGWAIVGNMVVKREEPTVNSSTCSNGSSVAKMDSDAGLVTSDAISNNGHG